MTNHLNIKLHSKELADKSRELVSEASWPDENKSFVLECISAYENLSATLREKEIAISNLKTEVFGSHDERTSTLFPDFIELAQDENESTEDATQHCPKNENESKPTEPRTIFNFADETEKRKWGHGRRNLKLHASVEPIRCKHEAHSKGDQCPACKEGRLSSFKTQQKTVVQSVQLVVVQSFELESLKCATCDVVTTACEPNEVKVSYGKYHPSAIAQFANLRYLFGMASHRLEKYTMLQGLRVPETTQFRLFEYACMAAAPVFRVMAGLAAEGVVTYRDDSWMRVHSLKRRLKEEKIDDELKAITTTVFTSQTFDGKMITLYSTNNLHAGHAIESMLEMRSNKEPMLAMADALSANRKHSHREKVIELNCLIHARRNFVKLAKYYPDEVKVMLDLFGSIYEVDRHAKNKKYDWQSRLLLHKEHSLVVLNTMMVLVQVAKQKHDGESSIRTAYQYVENHWPRLIGFIKHAGAPLDNSQAERDIKSSIRHRKNSLAYATEYGAYVGDVLMSVMKTADGNGVSPVRYLEHLLQHVEAVKARPGDFLPWCIDDIALDKAS